jgi:tRNA 2-thiouridine synthesizing protein E
MVKIKVFMRASREPLKRTPIVVQRDGDDTPTPTVLTDRGGVASFDLEGGSGKVLVSGIERYHGPLSGEIAIGLWSMTQAADRSEGAQGEFPDGSNAYPDMTTHSLWIDGNEVLTDSEGYLINPAQWSEAFTRAEAAAEDLTLGKEHWEVIRYLRDHYSRHGTQASVRDMIRYFRQAWDTERGSSRHLHRLFPRGGPQKQGNRLAGLLRTKGEH